MIRDCMALSFLKKLDPDAPEAGCVDLKFTGGGEVSKKTLQFIFRKYFKRRRNHQNL